MNIGIDFHDTLSFAPEYFKLLMYNWSNNAGNVYIVTGTPESLRSQIIEDLKKLGIYENTHYITVLMGFEYKKENMSISHFQKMREYKLELIKKHNIQVYYDDNPYYAQWMKDNGIITFMPCISESYMKQFSRQDAFFTCHLQEKLFNYLDLLDNDDVLKK